MATLASSSELRLRYVKETAFGVIPTTGEHKVLPLTGESLNYEIQKTESEELSPERGVADMTAVSSSASGGVSLELKASAYDDFIEAALQGTWSTQATGTDTIAITETTMTFTGNVTLVAGQFFALKGLPESSPNKNKLFRVKSVAAKVVTLHASTPAVAEASVTATVSASRLVNASVRRSFSLEKEFADIGVFRAYRGMNVSGFSLNAAQGSLTTGEISFMGRDGMESTRTTSLPATAATMPSRRTMSGMTGAACGIWLNGAPLAGTYMQSLSLTVDNNMRQQNAMCAAESGVPGAVGIGNGRFNANLTAEVFFTQEDTLYSEFVKNREVEISFTAFDTEGYGYVFTLARGNVASHTVNASGGDSDVMASIEVTGLKSASGLVLSVDRISFV